MDDFDVDGLDIWFDGGQDKAVEVVNRLS